MFFDFLMDSSPKRLEHSGGKDTFGAPWKDDLRGVHSFEFLRQNHFIFISGHFQGRKIINPPGGYPPEEVRGSHPVFSQWASKYQERTNHSNVHARAKNFSTYYIMYVLRQNYWTFMRFVDFLSSQLISLIRWNLSIYWWKVLGPF